MERASPPPLNPGSLPVGTVVGSWRVVDWGGRGVHGAVYRAVPVDSEHSTPIALKLALRPEAPRFAREEALLRRLRHPHVPRLWDSGAWLHPSGSRYPFLAMDWVDGLPLYSWAEPHPLSPSQVPRLLAQLARALAALHALGAVHRDVKGANILVRRSDGHAFLTDFGSGHHPGAATLTPPGEAVGTPAYRAPEAGLFELNSLRDRSARYTATGADDLYSLGVTACRLVTGEYPQFADPAQDKHGRWYLPEVLIPASLGRTEPRLREPLLRLLSVNPEHRGTAAELAEALEQAAESPARSGSHPPRRAEEPPASRAPEPSAPELPAPLAARAETPSRWSMGPRLALAAGVLALCTWAVWSLAERPEQPPAIARAEPRASDSRDAGTAGLGDAAASTTEEEDPSVSASELMTEDTLPEPEEGQAVPDSKGRCPHKKQIALNGGCWGPLTTSAEQCETLGGRMYGGTCYVPIYPHGRHRPPTSHPVRRPKRQ